MENNFIIEKCAQRIETYILSLEVSEHLGLPSAIQALNNAIKKIRALQFDNELPPLLTIHQCDYGGNKYLHFAKNPPDKHPFHFLYLQNIGIKKIDFCPWCGTPLIEFTRKDTE